MYSSSSDYSKVIPASALPEEFQPAAESLFPSTGSSSVPNMDAAAAFTALLGIKDDYQKILNASEAKKANFLQSFSDNINLLIQKTWVEKADEYRKERLQQRIPGLVELIEKASYSEALSEFGAILDELANLLFGAQSHKDDFTEYTMRIDPQIGLFWWYGAHLEGLSKLNNSANLYPVLLIGLCYLTNF
jgi:hypothetical protein